MRKTVRVSGMSCMHCARRVESALKDIAGVSAATVDLAGGTASVECDGTVSAEDIAGAVREAGYEVVG